MLAKKHRRIVTRLLKEGITSGKEIRLKVITNSMQPLINPGEKVVAKRGPAEEFQCGNIILFEKGGILCIHRLLAKKRGGTLYITKGDKGNFWDEPLSVEQILGKVVTIEKGSRIMDLEKRSWRIINWLLALFSLIEGAIFGTGYQMKRVLWGKKRNPFTPLIKRLLRLPSILFSKAIARFFLI